MIFFWNNQQALDIVRDISVFMKFSVITIIHRVYVHATNKQKVFKNDARSMSPNQPPPAPP